MHLSSILPFLKKYSGSIFVIKYGGSTMTDSDSYHKIIQDILLLYYLGIFAFKRIAFVINVVYAAS